MRVLLINPTLAGESFSQHLGITSMASYINACTRHRAEIVDFGFRRKGWQAYLQRRIRQFEPDVFGVTVSSPTVSAARTVINALKPYGRPVVCGGTHCTILPEQAIRELTCDAVCIGEGEFTLQEYLDRLEAHEVLTGVKGLWFVRDGEIVKNAPRPVNQHIDDLPENDWSLWEDIDFHLELLGMISFYGSRGCPHSCTYCTSATLRQVLPGNFRLCSPRRYARRIAYQWERFGHRGFRVAWLWDQVFTYNLEWLSEFCDEYRRLGLHRLVPYSVYARGDELDEERVRLLVESGCIIVRIGFESGDDWIRYEVYQKRISRESYSESVRLCRKYGLSVTGYFILGGPGETWRTMWNTYHLAANLAPDVPTFYVYKPLPRTAAVDKLRELGGYFVDVWHRKVVDIRFGGMVYTPHLSPREVEFFQWFCALTFIPRLVWRQLRRLRLHYLGLLARHLAMAWRRGVSLVDAFRHFTYTMDIQAARQLWERRCAQHPHSSSPAEGEGNR